MKKEIWVHAGAYGELKALLPLLDKLHVLYPNLGIWVTTNEAEILEMNLKSIRDYFERSPVIFKNLSLAQTYCLFSVPPVLWISSSYFVESNLLFLCSLCHVPVFYIYDGFLGIQPENLKPDFRTTLGIVTQADKHKELAELGMNPQKITQLKSLKWLYGYV